MSKPLSVKHFEHRVEIKGLPISVTDALTDEFSLQSWLAQRAEARPEVGAEIIIPLSDRKAVFQVQRINKGREVLWECIECKEADSGLAGSAHPLVGSHAAFRLTGSESGGTELRFVHEGLTRALECHDYWADLWTRQIGDSLKSFVETGFGTPED